MIKHLYRNNLKNRESDKEAPRNSSLERGNIVRRQGSSKEKNCGEKQASPETDSSSCFGIWQRYLFKEITKTFFFFLIACFSLYALIDYSLHMQDFLLDKKIQFAHIFLYYLAQLIKRAELLIPLALLLTTLKVLFSLNTKGELIALQASGIPKHHIIKPFFLFGLICVLFGFLSTEFLLPTTLNGLDKFRYDHFRHSKHNQRKERIHVISLKDHSRILYRKKDLERSLYQDVFWIRSVDDVWHMQTLSLEQDRPIGFSADHLQRSREGYLEKTESFDHIPLKLRFEVDATGKGEIPLENRKVSELIKLCNKKGALSSYEYPQALTYLLFKLITPLLSLLVILAVTPFCLKISRTLPFFATYALSLLGFVALFALFDAAVILSENLILSPYIALLTPLTLLLLFFYLFYQRSVRRI